jgi:hypothetical protein
MLDEKFDPRWLLLMVFLTFDKSAMIVCTCIAVCGGGF